MTDNSAGKAIGVRVLAAGATRNTSAATASTPATEAISERAGVLVSVSQRGSLSARRAAWACCSVNRALPTQRSKKTPTPIPTESTEARAMITTLEASENMRSRRAGIWSE